MGMRLGSPPRMWGQMILQPLLTLVGHHCLLPDYNENLPFIWGIVRKNEQEE
jgi:hypothetical protein